MLRANVECPECGTVYDGIWTDDSISIQDMVDAPVADQVCPNPDCGYVDEQVEYPGWMNWSNAG